MGAGRWRGGQGAVREFELLSDAGVSIEGDGHKHRPWGFDGGAEGHPATLYLQSGNTRTELPSKMPYRRVHQGDRFVCIGPCGGGYGGAGLREPDAVRADVADGLLTRAAAAETFGVVLTQSLAVDAAATATARRGTARERLTN
jgi:N-methylhydantoinase B